MSTLKVNTIQDASGGNSSTPNEISQGRAKAWLNFRHTDNTIRDSFGISSVTDQAQGEMKVVFSTARPNVNYSAVVSCGQGSTNIGDMDVASITEFETTQFEIQTFGSPQNPGTEDDMVFVCVAVFGD
tara:strand:- start:527 stop:910 length:384 start_codon:yes stop_codon:yes gene_type:complete